VVLIAVTGLAANLFLSVPLSKQTWLLAIVAVVLLLRATRAARQLTRQGVLIQVRLLEAVERQSWTYEVLLELEKKGGQLMSQIEDLKSAVQEVATAEADVEKRIDTLIEALKLPHDDPAVGEMIAQLEGTRARLAQFHQTEAAPTGANSSTIDSES
jgi:hypothetical protein